MCEKYIIGQWPLGISCLYLLIEKLKFLGIFRTNETHFLIRITLLYGMIGQIFVFHFYRNKSKLVFQLYTQMVSLQIRVCIVAPYCKRLFRDPAF